MKCPECGSNEFTNTAFNFDYSSECGIPGVVITSATRMDCVKCDNVLVNLGKLRDIDQEICKNIVSTRARTTMPGAQLRFLRRKFFRLSLDEFAALTKIDTTTLDITERKDLELNLDLSDIVRGLAAIRMLTPNTQFEVTLLDEVIQLGKKKT